MRFTMIPLLKQPIVIMKWDLCEIVGFWTVSWLQWMRKGLRVYCRRRCETGEVLPGRLTARPLKFYYPKKKVVFQLSFCRGELLNFRVVYWFYMTNKLFVSLQCRAEISLDTGTQLIPGKMDRPLKWSRLIWILRTKTFCRTKRGGIMTRLDPSSSEAFFFWCENFCVLICVPLFQWRGHGGKLWAWFMKPVNLKMTWDSS